jgi:uncharacterized damage-inducible protein DinB
MDANATAWQYLRSLRETVLWKVEGLPEREQRMPRTPTGTNLLGIVKHLAGVEGEYFGLCLGRRWADAPAAWGQEPAEPNADMWASAEESPQEVLDLYRRVAAWADAGIRDLPGDHPVHVPWWREPDTDLHRLVVHMAVETARHAGQMDILREQVDGEVGLLPAIDNMPDVDATWWTAYVERLRGVAERSG